MRNTDIIIFIFTDETNEIGDESSSKVTTGQKQRDWASQVENEQQQEAEYSTDSMSQSNTLPKDPGRRGRRRGRKRNNIIIINYA
jgi:hypothetical protein